MHWWCAIARVAWCRGDDVNGFEVGLELMRESTPRMLVVRPDRSRGELAVNA